MTCLLDELVQFLLADRTGEPAELDDFSDPFMQGYGYGLPGLSRLDLDDFFSFVHFHILLDQLSEI